MLNGNNNNLIIEEGAELIDCSIYAGGDNNYIYIGKKCKFIRDFPEGNMDLREAQKVVYKNKIDKGFNVTDVNKEFCLLYGEVAEAYEAYRKKKEDLGEELADIAIYLLGLSEILGIDLASEIENKIQINQEREYKTIDGVFKRVSKR